MLVAHHRHIIEAVHVADIVVIGLTFGELFSAAVQEADVRINSLHDFSVHLHH